MWQRTFEMSTFHIEAIQLSILLLTVCFYIYQSQKLASVCMYSEQMTMNRLKSFYL